MYSQPASSAAKRKVQVSPEEQRNAIVKVERRALHLRLVQPPAHVDKRGGGLGEHHPGRMHVALGRRREGNVSMGGKHDHALPHRRNMHMHGRTALYGHPEKLAA